MVSTANQLQIDLLEQDRFYQGAPHKPYYAKEKGCRTYIAKKEIAFKFPYIQHNQPALCLWMTFDIDHQNLLLWDETGLPEPNLIVRNLDNKKCHLSYAIDSVCTSPAAKPKPLAYLAAVEDAYRKVLMADQCYTGLLTKNPYNDQFSALYAHDHVFTLSELEKHVELERHYWTRKRAVNDEQYGFGRHMAIFHRLRFWGYPEVLKYRENGSSYNQWMDAVFSQCESYNTFPRPLEYSSVKSTAKSVGNFCWFKYWPEGKPVMRGAMAASFAESQIPLNLAIKQRLSARRTNEMRRGFTDQQIDKVIQQIQEAGQQATKKSIAKHSGLSFETVKGRKAGISRSDYLEQADEKRQRAIDLYNEGLSQREIAEKLGVSRGAVRNYLQDILDELNADLRKSMKEYFDSKDGKEIWKNFPKRSEN